MQKKIIIDSCVYIELFNTGLHKEVINPFQNITYLAYPVLHELWMGLKGRTEIRALTQWRDRFIRLKRIVLPSVSTLSLIGEVCLELRMAGKLDPVIPKHYNDVYIAALAYQIGAVVLTKNVKDFMLIQKIVDFEFKTVG